MKIFILFLMTAMSVAVAAAHASVFCPDYLGEQQNYLFNAGLEVGSGNDLNNAENFQEIFPDQQNDHQEKSTQLYHLKPYASNAKQIFLSCVYNNGQTLNILVPQRAQLCTKQYYRNARKNSSYIILFSCE